jgi:hypothetical protein
MGEGEFLELPFEGRLHSGKGPLEVETLLQSQATAATSISMGNYEGGHKSRWMGVCIIDICLSNIWHVDKW